MFTMQAKTKPSFKSIIFLPSLRRAFPNSTLGPFSYGPKHPFSANDRMSHHNRQKNFTVHGHTSTASKFLIYMVSSTKPLDFYTRIPLINFDGQRKRLYITRMEKSHKKSWNRTSIHASSKSSMQRKS